MASAIPTNFGQGGAGLTPENATGGPTLATALRDAATDLAALRGAIVAITAKLDADSGDTGGDSNYAATCDPAALTITAA